jgi:hypothetical protein
MSTDINSSIKVIGHSGKMVIPAQISLRQLQKNHFNFKKFFRIVRPFSVRMLSG